MTQTKTLKIKTGVMGGSFDPFHLAHLNSLLTVRERFSLKNIIVIPSFQTPLSREETASPSHRLKMLKKALSPWPFFQVDDQEIRRKGISYTQETITQLLKNKEMGELFFIMGLDQFHIFDQWKNWTDILKKTNLIVTSRPGAVFPQTASSLPKAKHPASCRLSPAVFPQTASGLPRGLKPLIKKKTRDEISLRAPAQKIYFCPLKDMDISSSDIRQRLQEGKETEHLLPQAIFSYIKKHKLYLSGEEPDKALRLIEFSAKELGKKKAYDIKSFDLRLRPLPFSFGLIASCSNIRQTKTAATHIKAQIKKYFELLPINEEGWTESQWIVLDYGDLIIHIFYDYTNRIYKLAELWESPSAPKGA